MAVAETASAISGQKLPTVGGGVGVVAPASWKFCTLVLALALTWQSVAHAQILVDRNAPREEQPMVLKAANGVPVVNIRQPNAKGLSVNSYRRFDVDGRGVMRRCGPDRSGSPPGSIRSVPITRRSRRARAPPMVRRCVPLMWQRSAACMPVTST